jgi:hypothetical protein
MTYYEKQIAAVKDKTGLINLGCANGEEYFLYFDPVKEVIGFKKNFSVQDSHVKGITYIPAELLPAVKARVDELLKEEAL